MILIIVTIIMMMIILLLLVLLLLPCIYSHFDYITLSVYKTAKRVYKGTRQLRHIF